MAKDEVKRENGHDKSYTYKTVTVRCRFQDKKGSWHLTYDVAGMKKVLRKIIDENIYVEGGRFSRDELKDILDEYIRFCFFDFLKLEVTPDECVIEMVDKEKSA